MKRVHGHRSGTRLAMGLQMLEGVVRTESERSYLPRKWPAPREGSQAVGSGTDLKEMNSQEKELLEGNFKDRITP